VRLTSERLVSHRLLEGTFVALECASPSSTCADQPRRITTPKHLLRHLTGGAVAFPRASARRARRLAGKSFLVFGKDSAVEISLANPARPQSIGPLTAQSVGHLADIVADGDHAYMLGDRGLQVASNDGKKVSDSIQVHGDQASRSPAATSSWRARASLEVIDVGPYQVRDVAALDTPAPASEPEPAPAAAAPAMQQSPELAPPGANEMEDAATQPPAAPGRARRWSRTARR